MKRWLLLLLVVTSLLVAGCESASFPEATPSQTPRPGETSTPSPTRTPPVTLEEDATSIPTSTLTPIPTLTPTPTPSPKMVKKIRTESTDFHAGVSVLIYGNDVNFDEKVVKLLDRLVDDNVNSLSLVFPLYQESWDASKVTTYEQTPSDENIASFIKKARERGFTVMVRPTIDEEAIKDKTLNSCSKPLNTLQWRGNIEPCNRNAWFMTYRNIMLHYAELADNAGASIFCIGAELNSMVGDDHASFWKNFIPEVRSVFDGELTYSNNWDFPQDIGFWHLLDYVGVDAFYRLSVSDQATHQQLVAAWQPSIDRLKKAQETYGKPILFTEVGVTSEKGSFKEPWVWEHNTGVDLESQRLFYAATCEAAKEFVSGFYFWNVALDPPSNPSSHTGFNPLGKPAEEELANCYK